MTKLVKLRVSPYPIQIWFTNDILKFKQKRKDILGTEITDVGVGHCSTDGYGCIVFGVFDKKLSTLVHELSHVMVHIFEYIGMNINNHTTEAFAYLMDNLYTQCENLINMGDSSE